MLPVGVQDDHGVGVVLERRADAGGHGRPLALVRPQAQDVHARVIGGCVQQRGDRGRRAVVDEDDVVDVAQRLCGHGVDARRPEDGDHGGQPPDRRVVRRDSGPSAPALGARERHEPGEAEGAHREERTVGPGRGDDRAGDRQGRRGCDRARGEEGAGVLARLPVGHEAHEVGEADRRSRVPRRPRPRRTGAPPARRWRRRSPRAVRPRAARRRSSACAACAAQAGARPRACRARSARRSRPAASRPLPRAGRARPRRRAP